jgi:hypothetical protein
MRWKAFRRGKTRLETGCDPCPHAGNKCCNRRLRALQADKRTGTQGRYMFLPLGTAFCLPPSTFRLRWVVTVPLSRGNLGSYGAGHDRERA